MSKTAEKNLVKIFGLEVERKNLELQELVNLLNEKFNKTNIEVGKVSYFILALRKEKMINICYDDIVLIVKSLMSKYNMVCNTTVKCMAYYNKKLKDINYNEEFKSSGRIKAERINLENIKF